jgi:hypothetical protein
LVNIKPSLLKTLKSEIAVTEPIETKADFDLQSEAITNEKPNYRAFPKSVIYSFPSTGIYFSTRTDKNLQPEFQIELTYEKQLLTRKVRCKTKKCEKLIINSLVFDGESEYKNPSIEINKNKITLKTSKVGGVDYKFEGTFTKDT